MKVALIVTIYNRPEYLEKCFKSLYAAQFPKDTTVYLIDDASPDPLVKKLCSEFATHAYHNKINLNYIPKEMNSGIKESLKLGVSTAFSDGNEVIINLDGDAVVKPDFIKVLLALKKKCPDRIVSGFNCVSPTNPNVFDKGDHYLKQYCNGINACFTKDLYYKYIVPGLEKHGNWDYNASVVAKNDSSMFAVTKPSVVQHIGLNSSMGHMGSDYAQDYKLYHLPEVTLFGIDAHDPEGIKRAAEISQRDIEFGAVKIITERLFPAKDNTEGRLNYSKFMIRNLNEHFETSHVLTIHADGYILRPEAFKKEWLQYDYIGATWDFYNENMVGNGGFSLRSKKLCEILAVDNTITEYHPEDMIICRTHRSYLESKYGIKFAPVEVAKKFSIEGWGLSPTFRVYNGEFGFHGYNIQFAKSTIPQFMWPKTPHVEQKKIDAAPGRFIPSATKVEPYKNPHAFPNFLPERLRPKGQSGIIPKRRPLQLLILCGSSQGEPYPQFLEAQQKTWDSVNVHNVQTVFFREGPDDKWIGNICEVCTSGEYLNAHWRHKLAIDAVWKFDWDIIFRPHASSYVNKAELYELCKNLPREKLYGGWELGAELPEIEWEGHKIRQSCISGAGIFYSRDVADILRKKTPSGINIEEHVLAGRLLQINGQPVTFVNKDRVDMASINDYKPSYHYRLKSSDRMADIQLMHDLHNKILSEKK